MAKTFSSNFSNNVNLAIVKKQEIEFERQKGFWQIFFEVVGISILAISAGALTGGLASGFVAGFGTSMVISETAGFVASAVTQFAIQQTYDSLNGNSSALNVLLNLLFSLDRIGRIGRGIKADKILKAANELDLFNKIGVNGSIRNFAQLQSQLVNKRIITNRKVILSFGKKVSNEQILSTINVLATETTMSQIKLMTANQLENLIILQRNLRKLAPSLTPIIDKAAKAEMTSWLEKTGITFENFIRLTDEDAIIYFNRINQSSKISYKNLQKLDSVRQASKFHNNFIDSYTRLVNKVSSTLTKINPVYWLNKVFNKMLQPVYKAVQKIQFKAFNAVKRITGKVSKTLIEKGIVPSIDQEMFVGFQIRPISINGQCLLRIIKKPYISSKTGRVTKYGDVYVTCSLIEAEKFLINPHQKSYYLENWAMGWGYTHAAQLNSVFSRFIGTQVYFAAFKTLNLVKKFSSTNPIKSLTSTNYNSFTKSKVERSIFGLISTSVFGNTGGSAIMASFFNKRDTQKVAVRKITKNSQRKLFRQSIKWSSSF